MDTDGFYVGIAIRSLMKLIAVRRYFHILQHGRDHDDPTVFACPHACIAHATMSSCQQ